MTVFSYYLNNLYKTYLGIIKIFNAEYKDCKRVYNLNLYIDEHNNQLILFNLKRIYILNIKGDKLEFWKDEENIQTFQNIKYVVDIQFTRDPIQATSFSLLKQLMNAKYDRYTNNISQLLQSYNRTIVDFIKQLRLRNRVNKPFNFVDGSRIQITNLNQTLIDKIEKHKRVSSLINGIHIPLIYEGDSIFRVLRNAQMLRKLKNIPLYIFSSEESRLIYKFEKARNLLIFNPDSTTPLAKITALLNQGTQIPNLDTNENYDFPFNNTQEEMLSYMKLVPLFVIDGLAGTGKTTTLEYGIISAAKAGKRILILSEVHKVVDNILEKIIEIDPQMKNYVTRLASDATIKSVSSIAKEYHQTRVSDRIKEEILEKLDAAIAAQTNEKIKAIQNEIIELITLEKAEEFQHLVNLSSRMFFSTVDGTLSQYFHLGANKINIQQYENILPEFDITIFEDATDVNFIDFVLGTQFSYQWIISGDSRQIKPVMENIVALPRYSERSLPNENDEIEYVNSMREVESQFFSQFRYINRGSKRLRLATSEILMSDELDIHKPIHLEFYKNYRFSTLMGTELQRVFSIDKYENGKQNKDQETIQKENTLYNFYPTPFILINSHQPGKHKHEENIQLEDGSKSYRNIPEAELVINKLVKLLNHAQKQDYPLTIALVSHYRAQALYFYDLLVEQRNELNLFEDGDIFHHKPSGSTVCVETTHKHKSREYDISLISFTRSEIIGLVRLEDYAFTSLTRARYVNLLFFDVDRFSRSKNIPKYWKKILEQL